MQKQQKKYLLLGTNNREHSRHLQLVRVLSRMNADTIQASWPDRSSLRYKAFTKKWSGLVSALGPRNISSILRFQAKLLSLERGSEVVLEHPSQLNFLIAFPIAKLRGHKITTDFYVGLHDTLVIDRRLVKRGGLLAKTLSRLDKLTLRNSDKLIFASHSDRKRFSEEAGVPLDKSAVLLPSPPDFFKPPTNYKPKRDVVFVGEFSPLMGLDVVLECIKMPAMNKFTFTIVGTGQESPKIKQIVGMENVRILDWVEYQKLPELYADHKLSLGIFGASQKAKSVFPNKIMESLRVGVPVITASTEIMEIFGEDVGARFVPNCDPKSTAEVIRSVLNDNHYLQVMMMEAEMFNSAQGSDRWISSEAIKFLERF